ncbi:MAG: AI-2E family transporter, partial [Clostridiales bacterium]|nr:AI-2E family transporter [Clostridiales bacterium]
MKIFDKYYNKEYTLKAIYVIGTVLITFTLGLLIYYLSGKIGGAVSFVSGVLTPLILGLVITYLLSPVVKKLEEGPLSSLKKQSSRRVAAVILTFIIVLLALGLILGAVAFTVSRSLSSFSFSEVKEYITILSVQFSNFWDTIEQQLASMNINLGSLGDMLGRIFNSVKNGATTLLFAIIFAIYFLLDHKIVTYWGDVLKTFTNEKTRAKLRAFAADADRVFSGYIRGQSIDAMIVGVLSAIALFIGGIPYAVVIGILTGVGNLVPYVGPVVGFGSLIIVCLAEGSIMHLLIGGIILAAVMFIDGNIINPRMLSSNVEVHPVLVIIALIAGGKFGGVVGMLVAVPVAALLKLQF